MLVDIINFYIKPCVSEDYNKQFSSLFANFLIIEAPHIPCSALIAFDHHDNLPLRSLDIAYRLFFMLPSMTFLGIISATAAVVDLRVDVG